MRQLSWSELYAGSEDYFFRAFFVLKNQGKGNLARKGSFTEAVFRKSFPGGY